MSATSVRVTDELSDRCGAGRGWLAATKNGGYAEPFPSRGELVSVIRAFAVFEYAVKLGLVVTLGVQPGWKIALL